MISVNLKSEGKFENDFSLSFNAKLGERRHFCTALDMYDVEISFWKKGKFGLEVVTPEEVPEEMMETFTHNIIEELIDELQEDDRKYLFTALHVGEDSGWGYSEHSEKNAWLMHELPVERKMVIDDRDGMEFIEFLMHKSTLDEVYDREIATKTYIEEDTKPKVSSGGVTEEMLEQYLREVA